MAELDISTDFDGTSVGFSYTPTGRRATMVDERGTARYVYDERGELVCLREDVGALRPGAPRQGGQGAEDAQEEGAPRMLALVERVRHVHVLSVAVYRQQRA